MMDINDILDLRMDSNPIAEEPMLELEMDNDEGVPTAGGANPPPMSETPPPLSLWGL